MEKSAKIQNTSPKQFSNEVIGILTAYPWSGDVVQLRSVIDWILTMANTKGEEKSIIEIEDLPKEILEGETSKDKIPLVSALSGLSMREAREVFEREYFIEQLKKFQGNISQMAKFVGMERSALHRKLKTLNIYDTKSFKIAE